MPPSSTGAGGVGASCVSDNDCRSRLCGLANNGSHMCFAANANDVQGGCSLSTSGTHDNGNGTTAAAFILMLALIGKVARARGRAARR